MTRDRTELEELIAQACAGDVGAFEALYHQHQAGVYSFVHSQVRAAELAADLTQQTFVRAWESLPRLRRQGAFRGWLYRIAANLVRDEMKSGRARLEVLASDVGDDPALPGASAPGPEDAVVSEEARRAVWAALGELPPEQRAAVVMHHMEDLPVNEIAAALSVRPGTVMSRLARAREALRKRLAPFVEDSDAEM